jgi:Holliday junction resolvase RusA-like endonuclease
MADSYHFFMALDPPTATQQEKKIGVRNGKPYTYPDERWEKARDTLWAHLEPHRPSKKIERPRAVMLDTTWCFPKGDHIDGEPHTDKPDTDNLEKGLKDIMTKLGWWDDDCQVFSSHTTKIYSRIPGIRIDIEEVKR